LYSSTVALAYVLSAGLLNVGALPGSRLYYLY
jgi:hypothetical protein